MNDEIIKLVKIKKNYREADKSITVLNNISLSIKKGELIALTGPSGSGKSTLLHIIALLDQPTSGEVFFKKKNFSKSNDNEKDLVRRKGISIIYQQNNLLPDFTALENVYLSRLAVNNNKNEAIFDAKKIIKSFGLSSRMDHFPSELSGGELQRVAISRALINKPEIILADEPTGSLDQSTAKDVFKTLYKLKNKNRLIIYATHNRLFANMADCKLEIIDGNIRKSSNARK